MKINQLQPTAVWERFSEICAIPHPSKHEGQILDYIKSIADAHHLTYKQDEVGNIVVIKPASSGYEGHKTVILQAHVDMVPQKNSDIKFNFETDAIDPYVDGDWVTARDTTLGADNGMGCAAMLAVLCDKEAKHPKIEALFTIDEETGLTGANGLGSDMLTGKILLNLDSEDEGELYVGCAGAVNNTATVEYKKESTLDKMVGYEVCLKGLKGGHSGMEIILQRGNSNKMLVRFLRCAASTSGVRIAKIDGGGLRNAIPREARAVVAVPRDKAEAFQAAAVQFEKDVRLEYAHVEDGIVFTTKECDTPSVVISKEDQKTILDALTAAPNGIFRMSDSMPGLVETSTNMSRVLVEDGKLSVLFMTRCMVNYGKRELASMIKAVFELAGGKVVEENDYDGWAPNMNSALLKTMSSGYKELYGKTPLVKAIHAGLECGIIGAKYSDMDMISFGPTIRYPHSPDEKVNIESVYKFYKFLLYTLTQL